MRPIFLALALLLAIGVPSAFAQDAPPLPAAWRDLLSADDVVATKGALAFAAQPKESVAFLAEKLRPLKAEPKLIARLLGELGDPDFRTREAAEAELDYFGKYIKFDLEKAAKDGTNAEAKERLTKLLGKIELAEKQEKNRDAKPDANPLNGGSGGRGVSVVNNNGQITIMIDGKVLDLTPRVVEKRGPPPAWTRAGRAIGVLEFLGTPEAVKLLEAMSLGEDTASPTRQAQDALARLKRKK